MPTAGIVFSLMRCLRVRSRHRQPRPIVLLQFSAGRQELTFVQILAGTIIVGPMSLGGGHLQVAEFHHKLGFEALRTVITSQVIVEVPGSGAGPPPGGLQPVQVGDQRLHHLALHHLLRPPGGLHSRRVALPDSSGAIHAGAVW